MQRKIQTLIYVQKVVSQCAGYECVWLPNATAYNIPCLARHTLTGVAIRSLCGKWSLSSLHHPCSRAVCPLVSCRAHILILLWSWDLNDVHYAVYTLRPDRARVDSGNHVISTSMAPSAS